MTLRQEHTPEELSKLLQATEHLEQGIYLSPSFALGRPEKKTPRTFTSCGVNTEPETRNVFPDKNGDSTNAERILNILSRHLDIIAEDLVTLVGLTHQQYEELRWLLSYDWNTATDQWEKKTLDCAYLINSLT